MFIKTRTLQARIKLSREHARKQYIAAHGNYVLPTWMEIHHKDFCPLNNDPDNLEALPRNKHLDIHCEDGKNSRSNKALNGYLDRELEQTFNDLVLCMNVFNNGL